MYIRDHPAIVESTKTLGGNTEHKPSPDTIMTVPYPYSAARDGQAINFGDLPRELVCEILGYLPTQELAILASTSRLFYCIISFLFRKRVKTLLANEDLSLIYECHVPSHRYGAPYNHCRYLGTTENLDAYVSPSASSQASKIKEQQQYNGGKRNAISALPGLGQLYTHFQPLPPDNSPPGTKLASTDVALESFAAFTQVCSQASLVKLGPRRGLFESFIPIFESFFRVRRKWLDENVEKVSGRKSARDFALAAAAASKGTSSNEPGSILWVGLGENIGLRVKVGNLGDRGYLQLGEGDKDVPAMYRIEYQELVIRTGYLLSKIENCRAHKRDRASMIMFAL